MFFLGRWFHRLFIRWVDSQNPISDRHSLHLKNLYIYPTKMGWSFLCLAILIWLLGTNYQNNLILALAYFQISLLVVCILHTFQNLANVTVHLLHVERVFAGEHATVLMRFTCVRRKGIHHVEVFFDGDMKNTFDFPSMGDYEERVSIRTNERGWLTLPRLRVESVFPMGLFKCGTWLRFETQVLVYPKLVPCALPNVHGAGDAASTEVTVTSDQQEFYGFRRYNHGEPLSSIAWKQYARGKGLLAFEYAEDKGDIPQLTWSDFYQGDRELAVSSLCFWVLEWSEQGKCFGVVIDNETFVVEQQDDVDRVLRYLALF